MACNGTPSLPLKMDSLPNVVLSKCNPAKNVTFLDQGCSGASRKLDGKFLPVWYVELYSAVLIYHVWFERN
ncbi:hypothetical protein F0562_035500 [Nyssa sinensis]|uniref:Uncharacterized protein n=1 Tax=Nyssa sinensis TaxID=561372 RepID=A0A5J5ADF7_9ASTE|nr:hypothetical protein F0562_035500 [Nyssa sinensis]